jgi:hypothetical protein
VEAKHELVIGRALLPPPAEDPGEKTDAVFVARLCGGRQDAGRDGVALGQTLEGAAGDPLPRLARVDVQDLV